ncbi:ABC transporter permease [Allopusillimonas ginsengisoli]|nr:ABC transporter permease [Allopusillimonas ginsengisoli]
MIQWLTKRLLQSVVVILLMTLIVFIGLHAIGDPVDILIGQDVDQVDRARIIAQLGLDQPLWRQYLSFLGGALNGDLGKSFVYNTPAIPLILQRFPATLELALAAMVIAVVIGVPTGLMVGLKPEAPLSRAVMASSILGFSLPTFWVGLMLIMAFSVLLGWLPASGRGQTVEFLGVQWSFLTWDGLKHMFLPALNLSLFKLSLVIRLTSAGVREVLPLDYIKFARAKGLSPLRIIGVHVLRNILIPLVTVLG